ncbi:MAG: ABC transporter ATP-binding protein [Thaumarchaeota archaeon]|nr:ABC transporter ATP-binding protein [Candidatus Calditenuaceae archaeon]MDW8041926.1 ABC transporter ATP-binding protein [Nitrososphaerota archaeon]
MSLEVRNLTKRFGGLVAVNGVSFTVERGELVGLIGPNGSGKTTLFNLIAGVLKPDGGEILFDGERIDGLRPDEVFRRGVVRSFQIPRTFWHVTVAENLALPPRQQRGERPHVAPLRRLWRPQELEIARQVSELIDALKLTAVNRNWGSEISGGQMKLTEIGRSMMSEGKLVLLDEPAAGVAVPLAHEIFKHVSEVRSSKSTTFIIIEHKLDILLEYVERVLVMHEGRIIYDGDSSGAVRDQKVVEAYLGVEAS